MTSMIKVPRIEFYGVGDLRRIKPFVFEEEIFSNIYKGSITLRDQAKLFEAYLKSELGEIELPEQTKGIVYRLFDKEGFGKRKITFTQVDYDRGYKEMKKVKESDRRVIVFNPEEEPIPTLIPESGYSELVEDGLIHPNTGFFFSSVSAREEAERSFTKRGYSPDFAQKAVSYIYSRDEGSGKALFVTLTNNLVSGRFRIDA